MGMLETSESCKYLNCSSFHLLAKRIITRKLQRQFESIEEYCSTWKLKLNAVKREFIIFTHKRKEEVHDNPVLNEVEITEKDHLRYVDVMLDKKLLFKRHIERAKNNAITILKILYEMKWNSEKLMEKRARFTRPLLTYGCELWNNTSETKFKKLKILWNKCLQMITGHD